MTVQAAEGAQEAAPSKAALWRAGNRERNRRWRERHPNRRSAPRQPRALGEWLAVDGEGWGEDELGRQCYRLMAAATDSGFGEILLARGERLTTAEILEWLCWLTPHYLDWAKREDLPHKRPRLCGFALGYDHAHILLDLNLEQLRALFHLQNPEKPWVEVGDYRLKLTGGRLQVKRLVRGSQKGFANLWDTYKYFQSSFLVAADKVMTPEERELILAGKSRRGQHVADPSQEAEYTLAECRVLARLMGSLEAQTQALELRPTSWYGPGSLAHVALKKQGMEAFYKPDEKHPAELVKAARHAFIGGRFETTGHGRLPWLYQYDINSAYPFAITKLPCLAHTRWRHILNPTLKDLEAEWSLVRVKWSLPKAPVGGWGPWPSRTQVAFKGGRLNFGVPTLSPSDAPGGGIPDPPGSQPSGDVSGLRGDLGGGSDPGSVRPGEGGPANWRDALGGDGLESSSDPLGGLSFLPIWPWFGENWIWGPEFRAGLRLLQKSVGWKLRLLEAWVPVAQCSCRPFDWVQKWYWERQDLHAVGDPRQLWIKLVLNSLYGKMAQSVGRPQWHSWLWAGMITAQTRSLLLDAICLDSEHVVMTATDAVYSTVPLALASSDKTLGAWEMTPLRDALIVQSGFLVARGLDGEWKPRTRGIPKRYVDWPAFSNSWARVLDGSLAWDQAKVVVDHDPLTGAELQIHVGIGLAQLWGKPEMLGRWIPYPREVTFKTDKRPDLWKRLVRDQLPDWIWTKPWWLPGGGAAYEAPGAGLDESKLLVTDQPDAVDWGEAAV